MKSKCNKCGIECPEEYLRKGIGIKGYLCPDCYELNKAITTTIIFCSICVLGVVITAIWG